MRTPKASYSGQLNRTTLIPSTCPQSNPVGKKYSVAILQASAGLELLTVSTGSASKRLYGTLIVPRTSNNLWKLARHFPGACISLLVQKRETVTQGGRRDRGLAKVLERQNNCGMRGPGGWSMEARGCQLCAEGGS